MPEQPSAWYDEFYEDEPDGSDERYAELYKRAALLIPVGSMVVDLGCGTGRFAKYALRRASSYHGIDFSPVAIRSARLHEPGATFEVGDLTTMKFPRANVYVLLEVLEHIEDDLGVMRRIPIDSTLIVSVPSYDSASHVRHFDSETQAAKRYSMHPIAAIPTGHLEHSIYLLAR